MPTVGLPKASSLRLKRTKGKERADVVPDEVTRWTFGHTMLGDFEKCAMDHTRWTADKKRVFITPEVIPRRSQSYSHSVRAPKNSFIQLGQKLVMGSRPMTQRRTAAGLSTARTASSSAPYSRSERLLRFLAYKDWSDEQFTLDEAWSAYSAALAAGVIDLVEPSDLLDFTTRLVERTEASYHSTLSLEELRDWGLRVLDILRRMDSEALKPRQEHARNCLFARASALTYDLGEPVHFLQDVKEANLSDADLAYVIPVYGAVFMAMIHHEDTQGGLTFLLDQWKTLSPYISGRKQRFLPSPLVEPAVALRQTVHSALREIESPSRILSRHRSDWDREQKTRVGELIMEVLNDAGLPEDALDVLEELQNQSIVPSIPCRLLLVRALARADFFELANSIFWRITDTLPRGPTFKLHLSTGLYLFGREGNVERAEEYYDLLQRQGWVTAPDVAMLMHASAVAGDTRRVVALFHQFFPEPAEGEMPAATPSIIHYSTVVLAHAQRYDIEGMNRWLEQMANAGIVPDKYIYNIVLQSFAKRGDMESLSDIMAQMRLAGITPSHVAYTTVIGALARRKDPVTAEAMFKRSLDDGVTPDRQMLVTLLNAHVEAGSWQGVIRVFDYLKASRFRHLRLTPAIYNTILKAYVLIGAPFSIVSALFDKLSDLKIRPDAYTFALLIQSACDAGMMDVASQIFRQMDQISEQWQSNQHINTYVMTILMAGYLRTGARQQAKAIYDNMRQRGIQPTAVTFASIVKAYATEQTEQGLKMAEDFIASLMNMDRNEWETTVGGRAAALDYVYAPLMAAYSRGADPESVERLYQNMLDAGGEPTLGLLTMLLDAYRRKEEIEAVLRVWPQIFQLAMNMSNIDPLYGDDKVTSEEKTRRHLTLLCIPLSIYVDALSAGGLHMEIALTWKKLQMFGFSFDSHNWNHLAVALVRSGEIERAFEILERVILPYQLQSQRIIASRSMSPETPYLFDTPPDENARPAEADAPANRVAQRRAAAAKTAATWFEGRANIEEEDLNDFVHPLHILHQVSPSWNQWKPHAATLNVLMWALANLGRGQMIEPVQPDGNPEMSSDMDEDDEKRMAKVRLCNEILERLYTNCPQAVRIVQQHQRDRALRDMRYTSVG
ncbi:hypothetical protein NEOLEDRAFT_1148673 [Neolentinus lepideus HHB14362 ss-1]|uniref:Pentacotripeptide-repeat region of PRORP domain-containing protein n=1 Tax=Neolentinus lepideus HHB14362 ss-1 TaxID=1314782 RepID=A0A165S2S2_9AGAM|nr:hypothetical protein NEOLEDRAFT_1148673 [Neolentinus lepideus HHB14362 ss-1]